MPSFRPAERNLKCIAVDFAAQIVPGTSEHAVNELVEQELDISPFIETYRNDASGAPAYHPLILRAVILFGDRLYQIGFHANSPTYRRHMHFIGLSSHRHTDFSSIASFVRQRGEVIQSFFASNVRRFIELLTHRMTSRNARRPWSYLSLA